MTNIVQHKRTKVKGNKPLADMLEEGEIALNLSNDDETIFLKNTENSIVEFKPANKFIQIDDSRITMLETSGNGNKFLSNDGTYRSISSNPLISGNTSTGGTILYDMSIGNASFDEVVLTQSVDSFIRLDICCCTDVGESIFTSVYNPTENNLFNVSSLIQESGEMIIKSKQYEINGDVITGINGVGGMSSISSNGISVVNGNFIGIYKVIGY